jgi:hypothetical protein
MDSQKKVIPKRDLDNFDGIYMKRNEIAIALLLRMTDITQSILTSRPNERLIKVIRSRTLLFRWLTS